MLAHRIVLLLAGWSQGDTVNDTVQSNVSLTTKHAMASRPRGHGALHPMQEPCLSPQELQATQDDRALRGLTTGHGRTEGHQAHDRRLQPGRQSADQVHGMLLRGTHSSGGVTTRRAS